MKNSAVANVLREFVDDLEKRAEFWNNLKDDPHGINTPVRVAILEVGQSLMSTLEKAYGPREELKAEKPDDTQEFLRHAEAWLKNLPNRIPAGADVKADRRERIASLTLVEIIRSCGNSESSCPAGLAQHAIETADALSYHLDKKA